MWMLMLAHVAQGADDGSCYGWLPAESIATIDNALLTEISGLVAGREESVLWTHNDAGDSATLYAIGLDGSDKGAFFVPGADNVDWEDVAIGPCGTTETGCSCLYIADIGDNSLDRGAGVIYRLPEPAALDGGGTGQTAVPEALRFRYPDGAHDAEALLVHPRTGEALILTKDVPAQVYAVALSSDEEVVAERIAEVDLGELGAESELVTGADFSPLGQRIVVRTDADVILFAVPASGELAAAFDNGAAPLPGPPEQDAEAVAFDTDGQSLYLAGESSSPELWVIQCVSYEGGDTADPLITCETETPCGCQSGEAASLLLLLGLSWRKSRRRPV